MRKIVFVNPPGNHKAKNNFSCGLFSLGTILLDNGYDVRIINIDYLLNTEVLKKSESFDENVKIFGDYILNDNPDLVSFYTMSSTYFLSIYLAKYIKEKSPNIKIAFGGPQATLTAKKSLELFNWIDCIGLGEGEKSINDIVYNLINNIPFDKTKGVAYRNKNNEIILSEMNLIENLDEIPLYNFNLLEGTVDKFIDIDVGRGCPFGCKYCSTKTFWKKKYRLKSIDRIINEIEYASKEFNIKKFTFEHDMFTFNRDYILEFCDTLIKKNLDIIWSCSSRVDMLDEELIQKLRASGCKAMFLGIETGSQRMQGVIRKGYKLETVIPVISLLKKYDIYPTISFIYGFPEETEEDIADTLELITQMLYIKMYKLQAHRFSVLPGTSYYDELKDKLYYSDTISDISLCEYIDMKKIDQYQNNIELFSQYLDFDIGIRKDLKGLNIFINQVLKLLIKCYARLFFKIDKYFNNYYDIYKMFIEFYKKEYNAELDENKYKISSFSDDFDRANKFIKYIFDYYDLNNNNELNALYEFESDVTRFMFINTDEEMLKTYPVDVYEYYVTDDVNNLTSNVTTLKFTRKEDKYDIGVVKVKDN